MYLVLYSRTRDYSYTTAGLALLATEFIWAKKLLNKFKEATSSISKSAKKVIKKKF